MRGWLGRNARTIATSCSPAPGRAMRWWAPMPPTSRRRIRRSSGRATGCAGTGASAATPGCRQPFRQTPPGRGSRPGRHRASGAGPILRDRYVLRLIAIDRAIHVIVLSVLAVVLFTFAGHDAALHRDYLNIMNDLSGGNPGAAAAPRRPRVPAKGVRLLSPPPHRSGSGRHRLCRAWRQRRWWGSGSPGAGPSI